MLRIDEHNWECIDYEQANDAWWQSQWDIANARLANAKDGTKLLYSLREHSDGGYRLRSRFRHLSKESIYHTSDSFIKINGKIYMLDKGHLLGEGAFGKVKYAMDEQERVFLIKIAEFKHSSSVYEYRRMRLEEEARILEDLSLSHGHCLIKHNNNRQKRIGNNGVMYLVDKHYITMKYLGDSLRTTLSDHLSDRRRVELAIELCWKVHLLHNGLLSKTSTPYVHMDLKPDNITVDENGNIHLVDFGQAQENPERNVKGKYNWLNIYQPTNFNAITKEQFDIFSLKRTIHLPSVVMHKGKMCMPKSEKCILSYDFLLQFKLLPYFHTTEKVESEISALELAAILIAAALQLSLEYNEIPGNPVLAKQLCDYYFKVHEVLNIEFDIIYQNSMLFDFITSRSASELKAIAAHLVQLKPLFIWLNELQLKQNEFFLRGEKGAEAACKKLHAGLTQQIIYTFDSGNPAMKFEAFRKNCINYIESARDILEIHSGVLGFLDAFLTCISSLVVFYPLVEYAKHQFNTHCLFFRTNSAKMLDAGENTVSTLKLQSWLK